ncbi:type VI secretion system accessory protein TagJ [Sandarakinorhabdus sp.]|uniref:type VI secretion system accessory protein TagJ n=1 Tax=Sandarakinorhabdus sp. TaxID=1916663 RepID=UPI00286E2247|nr:type VI secretion system accessory protein TagJ [Sandarakinorhabdus sp.]
MEAETLLKSGDMAGARQSLAALLRQEPGNSQARQFFWQLIAVHGEWEKAGTQLQALSTTEPKAMMLAGVYNQALAAMIARDKVFAGKERPKSIVGTEPWVEALLDAIHASNCKDPGAAAMNAAALEAAPANSGTLNGEAFAWIADADSRFGPMMEIIVGDQYGFVPFAAVKRIRSKGPEDLRDMVWLSVDLELRSGQSSAALTPVTYPGTYGCGQPALMLARGTDWAVLGGADGNDVGGAEHGLGQHLFTTDGPECGVLELRELTLD